MKNLKILMSLFFTMFLFACSSTQQISKESYASTTNFPQTNFLLVDNKVIKKPFHSDHQLMMSLLNRPMTEDQKMMLAFATQRAQETAYLQQSGYAYLNYVSIKGSKEETPLTEQPKTVYSTLINNDINAIQVTGSL